MAKRTRDFPNPQFLVGILSRQKPQPEITKSVRQRKEQELPRRAIFQKLGNELVIHNEIMVRSSSLDSLIAKSCVNLMLLTGDSTYPVSLPGSATLLKFRDRFFLVCTRHQLSGLEEGQHRDVCLPIEEQKGKMLLLTCSRSTWTRSDLHETDYHELVAFDFTEACEAYPDLKIRFFEIRREHPDFRADWVVGATAYGFPSKLVDYDFDSRQINVARLRVACRFSDRIDRDPAVHSLQTLAPLNIDPDGMSGGPTFFVLKEGSQARLHLAGINVTGSPQALRIIKSGAVLRLLRRVTEQDI